MSTFVRKKSIEQKIEDHPVRTGLRYKKNLSFTEEVRKNKWTKLPRSNSIWHRFLTWLQGVLL